MLEGDQCRQQHSRLVSLSGPHCFCNSLHLPIPQPRLMAVCAGQIETSTQLGLNRWSQDQKLVNSRQSPQDKCFCRYQSTIMGSFQTLELIETFINYQESIKRCICIIYDPQRTKTGSLKVRLFFVWVVVIQIKPPPYL